MNTNTHLIGFLGILLTACCAFGSPQDGLLLYASFEGGANATFAAGSQQAIVHEPKTVAGRVGKGLYVRESGVGFHHQCNVNMTRGTIAMFLKSETDFADLQKAGILLRAEHLSATYHSYRSKLFFMTGRNVPGKGFSWNYSLFSQIPSRWKKGEWHHVAIQWDRIAGERWLWLDGQCVAHDRSRHLPTEITSHIYFGKMPSCTVDEILIYETVLSEANIQDLAQQPEQVARELSLPTMQAPLASNSLAFTVPTIHPTRSIVAPKQIFEAPIRPANHGDKTFQGTVTFTLRDYQGTPLESHKRQLCLKPGTETPFTIPLSSAKRGVFKLEASWQENGKSTRQDVASFAVWDKRQTPDPNSFFGNHVNGWSAGIFLQQADMLGQNWMRNHNMVQTTWWTRVRPEKNSSYTWSYDFQLNHLKKFNMPLLGQFFAPPHWAVAKGTRTNGKNHVFAGWVPDLKLFGEYVTDTVNHYKDTIHHWEIWNEPGVSMFFKGTPEDFAQVLQVAIKATKKADPKAVVMASGFTTSWAWQTRVARAGGLKGLDAISIHYGITAEPPEIHAMKLQKHMDHFQNLCVKYGSGKPLPIWNTEGGCGSTTFLDGLDLPFLVPRERRKPLNAKDAAIRVVKASAVQQALGIRKHFIYLQNPPHRNNDTIFENTSMLDFNQVPKPMLISRVAMQEQLDYTSFHASRTSPELRFMGMVFQKDCAPNQSILLCWTGKHGILQCDASKLGPVAKWVDLMGNDMNMTAPNALKLTEVPVYIHVSASAKKVYAALQKLSFTVVRQPDPLPAVAKQEAEPPNVPLMPDYLTPQERPGKLFTLDLRKFCTMGLADDKAGDGKGGWADEGDMNDLRCLETGMKSFYGVSFDIIDPAANHGKSVLTLRGKAVTPTLPQAVCGIPVNRSPWKLYFLHAASWGTKGPIAEYVIHFTDGTQETIPLSIPHNINNWWCGYAPGEESRPVPVRVTNTLNGKPAWRYLRVLEWENVNQKMIKSLDIRSLNSYSTPIVISISGV